MRIVLLALAAVSIHGMPCDYSCSLKSASSYKLGANGLSLLTAFEGFSSTCYKDTEGIYT